MKLFLSRYQKAIFFTLALCLGIYLHLPYHRFQLHLAQGDHGRDLYGFWLTMKGGQPYRDYWWVYGPLMPYYYSLFYRLLGVNIHSILIGYQTLSIAGGLLFFLTLSVFSSPALALAGAVWYWVFNMPFEHTYNHIGGIAAFLFIVYMIFSYIKLPRIKYLYGALAGIFILFLIKLNFGLSTLVGVIGCILVMRRREKISLPQKKRLLLLIGGGLLLVLFIYGYFLRGMPSYAVRQCLPYFKEDRPLHAPMSVSLSLFAGETRRVFATHWSFFLLLVLLIGAVFRIIEMSLNGKIEAKTQGQFLFALMTCAVLMVLNLHEMLLSGVVYRGYWIWPLMILFPFLILSWATQRSAFGVHVALCLLLVSSCLVRHYLRAQLVRTMTHPSQYLALKRGQIFTGNSPLWMKTVQTAVGFLNNNLKENETFLALVDDPLYYFLTGRESPTRQLTFCNHLNITPDQEKEIIQAMEERAVPYVLLSSRSNCPHDPTMGIFGQTYCPLLANYLLAYFEPVVSYGDWDNPPEWVENHGVMIFKRKE